MQAMAHPLRLKILCLVGNQELSVLEIVDAVGTTQSNISQHLGVLRDHKILVARKEANKVFYRVEGYLDREAVAQAATDARR